MTLLSPHVILPDPSCTHPAHELIPDPSSTILRACRAVRRIFPDVFLEFIRLDMPKSVSFR